MTVASGQKLALRRAAPPDAARAFAWLTASDLTPLSMGPPWFPDRPVPSFAQFASTYPGHYFDGSRPFDGRALVMQSAALDLGVLAWHRIDLLRDLVELDVWLAGSEYARQGIAAEALRLASNWLQASFGVNRFLLRPSRRNVRALRCARRAGFRETDFEPAEVAARLGLPPSPCRDAVLLFRVHPLSRSVPVVEDSQLWVFIDSEFSSLQDPKLLSFGASCADGRSFYAEIQASGPLVNSSFVEQNVLPLLECNARPRNEVAQGFVQWLLECASGRRIRLVSDSGYDRWALGELLGCEDLPEAMTWQRVPIAYSELDRLCAELRLRRHHALDDALALRHAILGDASPEVHRSQDPKPVADSASMQGQ